MSSPEDTEALVAGGSPKRSKAAIPLTAFVVLLLAAAVGFALTRNGDAVKATSPAAGRNGAEPHSPSSSFSSGMLPMTRSTTGTTLPTTTTTRDPRPLPYPLPANPYEATPQVVLGQIEIPKLGVVGDMQEGITLTALNRGPGHWPGTPVPGGQGNMVIAGHRTTYSKPFNRLNELVAGDKVIFHMPSGNFTYEVRGVIIVSAANIGIASYSDAHVATLFACHPLHSAAQRIVAKLVLLGANGKPVDAESALPPLNEGSDPVTGTTLMVRDLSPDSPPTTTPLPGTEGLTITEG